MKQQVVIKSYAYGSDINEACKVPFPTWKIREASLLKLIWQSQALKVPLKISESQDDELEAADWKWSQQNISDSGGN